MDCRILGNESSSRAAVSISLCSAVFGNLSPTLSKSFPTFRLASIASSISPHLCYCYLFLRSFIGWLGCKFVCCGVARRYLRARLSPRVHFMGSGSMVHGSALARGGRFSILRERHLPRADAGLGSWFMVQSSHEGFNPLTRGSILSRGVQSSPRGVQSSREGFNLSRGPILSQGVQSSLEGSNPLARGSILSRGVQGFSVLRERRLPRDRERGSTLLGFRASK